MIYREVIQYELLSEQLSAVFQLAWLLADPVITSPIIGATSTVQFDENLGALDVQLSKEERQILNELTSWKAT